MGTSEYAGPVALVDLLQPAPSIAMPAVSAPETKFVWVVVVYTSEMADHPLKPMTFLSEVEARTVYDYLRCEMLGLSTDFVDNADALDFLWDARDRERHPGDVGLFRCPLMS